MLLNIWANENICLKILKYVKFCKIFFVSNDFPNISVGIFNPKKIYEYLCTETIQEFVEQINMFVHEYISIV